MVRGSFDGWNRGDVDAWLRVAHPEVEWTSEIVTRIEGAEAVYRGHAELRRYWDDWHSLWDVTIEVSEIRDLGDVVLVLGRIRTRGDASGIDLERTVAYVFRVRRRPGAEGACVPEPARSPRSRRADGVGDVSRERGTGPVDRAPWRLGDFRSVGWADPQIEFGIAGGPVPGGWTGIAAMGEAWRKALGGFDRLEMDVEECVSIDRERVLVLTTNTGRGKTSGVELGELRTRGANLFHIRGGKVTRLVAYWDRDRALEAVGLSSRGRPG